MVGISFLFYLLILIQSISSQTSFLDEFEYSTVMDEDEQFWLGWTVLNDSHIEFGMEVNATGWIAIGISPTGQMPNSDVHVAYVDDSTGEVYLYDMYTECRCTPTMDDNQDLILKNGRQEGTKTYITFIRSIIPCNDEKEQDIAISPGTTRVLFAYQYENKDGPTDPNNVAGTMEWHGSGNTKGGRSINLLLPSANDVKFPNETSSVELTMTNILVPSDDTTYMCKFMELPFHDKEQHIIKFEPVITPGNEGVLHHFVIFSCPMRYVNESNLNRYEVCDDYAEMPTSESECIGGTQIYAWAVGGDPFILPSHVGLSMSGNETDINDRLQYIVLQVHYDNPDERSDIIDSSGVKITYTPQLRQYEAGVTLMGIDVSEEGITIVNNLNNTLFYGQCISECTETLIDTQLNNASYIFASMLHAHVLGRSLKARHIRNNKELKPLDYNPTYDFDFQQTVVHDPEIAILPGDEILLECIYNSRDRDFISYGGESTREEMCLVYIYIYPKPNLFYCGSSVTNEDYNTFLNEAEEKGYFLTSTSYDTNNPDAMKLYYDKIVNSNNRDCSCTTSDRELLYNVSSYPKINIKEEYQEPDYCQNEKNSKNNKSWIKKNIAWFIPVIIICAIVLIAVVAFSYNKYHKSDISDYEQVEDSLRGETNQQTF